MYISTMTTGIGRLWLGADDKALLRVSFTPLEGKHKETAVIKQAKAEIAEYMNGTRQNFTVPTKLVGTEFQIKVWNILRQIPYGKVWSYKQVAEMLGNPQCSRAIGSAAHKNPLPIIIPCHRVVLNSGALGGYGGGTEIKQKLLDLETMSTL